MNVFVRLRTTMDVSTLTSAAQHLPVAVTAISDPKERYKVDAKSIMGLLSLNLSTPIELRWNDTDDSRQLDFLERIDRLRRDAEEFFYEDACERLC